MKKLIILVLLAAFMAACTYTSIEEDTYETKIQLIDKGDVIPPGERGKKGD